MLLMATWAELSRDAADVANDFGGQRLLQMFFSGHARAGIVVGKGLRMPIVDDQTGDNDVLRAEKPLA